jgi:hypothetical protein
MAMWFYLEYGRFPAGSAILTEEELATMILSAIEHDREDTLYRFRDLYRRNPAFLLRINRPGKEIVSSVISRLLDISDEKLASVISYLGEEGGSDKPDTELVLYALPRMIMSGEIENKSDIERLTERKGSRFNHQGWRIYPLSINCGITSIREKTSRIDTSKSDGNYTAGGIPD